MSSPLSKETDTSFARRGYFSIPPSFIKYQKAGDLVLLLLFLFSVLLSDEILSHIYRAGDEDDKALDDVLQIRVDAEEGKTYEDYS